MKVSLSDRIRRNPELIHSAIENEVVLLSIDNGKYYRLNQLGSIIWERIDFPIEIAVLCHELMDEYDVTLEDCENEVLAFVEQLSKDKLILLNG